MFPDKLLPHSLLANRMYCAQAQAEAAQGAWREELRAVRESVEAVEGVAARVSAVEAAQARSEEAWRSPCV